MEKLFDDIVEYANFLKKRHSVDISFCGINDFSEEKAIIYSRLAALVFDNSHFCGLVKGDKTKKIKCFDFEHKIVEKCNELRSWFVICCPYNICMYIFPIFHNGNLICYFKVGTFKNKYALTGDNKSSVNTDVDFACSDFKKMPEPSAEKELVADFKAFSYMLRYYYLYELNNNEVFYNNQIIDNAIRYIKVNYSNNFKLIDVANACNCNKNYLSSVFKKITGTAISSYINNCRINEAKKRIHMGETRNSLIATECGFNDSSYFSYIFKKYEGCSPNEYIAKMNYNGM